jgi:uncharacterized SAM-binding protein YcdF (DUF218 family)
MFLLKKAITPYLLPPGLFIVVLLLSGFWLFKKSWKGGLVNIMIGFFLWGASISPVSDGLMKGLETGLTVTDNPRGDVIIVLGGGVYDSVPDLSGEGAPHEDTLARLVTAVRLQKRLQVPVIVSGGAVFPWRKAEAPVDARVMEDLGVSTDKIILEERSRDTLENAQQAAEICKKYHFSHPLVVTSAYHMKRAILSFNMVGIDVTAVPCGFKIWKKTYHWDDYLPTELSNTSTACREYIGLLYYEATLLKNELWTRW